MRFLSHAIIGLNVVFNLQWLYIHVCMYQLIVRIFYWNCEEIGKCGTSANETTLHPNNNL